MLNGPDLAREYVEFARKHQLGSLRAELQVDGTRYEVLYERKPLPGAYDDGQEPDVEETITVKRGAKSRPQTIFAAPADWVIAGQAA